ncbi:MAG: hypothetical protein ACE14L_16925 [Terriglobales bacterium]
MAVGFIDQAIEHHAAVFLLVRSGLIGSAFALSRSVFESPQRKHRNPSGQRRPNR